MGKDRKIYEIGKEYPISENRIKIYTGKSWSYRTKTICANCGNEIYRETRNRSGIQHFCNKGCSDMFLRPKDSHILENFDDKNFYYLLGLISADGCVIYPDKKHTQQSYTAIITLQEKDNYILQAIQRRYGGVYFISEQPDSFHVGIMQQKYNWAIYNKKFVLYLKSIGITRKKSLSLDMCNFFDSISDDHKRSFMRGVIDGDGSICTGKDNHLIVSFVSGSKSYCGMVSEYLQNITRTNKDLYINETGHTPTYNINFTHKQSILICDMLYDGLDEENDLYLERKYKNYKAAKHGVYE